MEDVKDIASYICQRYQHDFGRCIDEMKLHKLLYLSQRESIIATDAPLFAERFKAWRYGPVMTEIRQMYKSGELQQRVLSCDLSMYASIFDYVFKTYAVKDSWSLSAITHGEYSWRKAREGYETTATCDKYISTDDIRVDAVRVEERRRLLRILGKTREEAKAQLL